MMIQKFLLLIIVATLTSTNAYRRGDTTAGARGTASSRSSSHSRSGGDVTKENGNGVLTIDRDDGKSGSRVK